MFNTATDLQGRLLRYSTHMKCEVKHNGDMGMWTFMPYNGWDIYGLMGGAFRVWLWLKWVGQLWLIMGGKFRVWLWLKWVGQL